MSENDVVVVGARCAGAVTAMLLARLGYRVTVVERGRIPSDTLSTHGIARSGVVQLARWGLPDQVLASGAPAIRQVAFRRATPKRSVLSSRGRGWTVHGLPGLLQRQ